MMFWQLLFIGIAVNGYSFSERKWVSHFIGRLMIKKRPNCFLVHMCFKGKSIGLKD
jgi:hypothetical protein